MNRHTDAQSEIQTATAQPSVAGLLQRKCSCGQHTIAGGQCGGCRGNDMNGLGQTSHRTEASEPSSGISSAMSSSSHSRNKSTNSFVNSSFKKEFSHVPVQGALLTMVQPKLKINQPGDKYEQEADRVAEMVLRMPDSHSVDSISQSPESVQSECASCASGRVTCPRCTENNGRIQRKSLSESITLFAHRQASRSDLAKEERLQRREDNVHDPVATPFVSASINGLRGAGQPLPDSERSFFEPRFGRDFGDVRVHTGSRAQGVSQAIHAKAFTVGKDIVFGSGQYSPGNTEGRRLLGHELTHVVQQTGNNDLTKTPIDTQSQTADINQTLAAPHIQGKWRMVGGTGNAGGWGGDSTSDHGSTRGTEICAPLKDKHKSCVKTRAHAWQGYGGFFVNSEGGRAKAFRWVTSEYTFRNEGGDADFLALRGRGNITGWAKAEDEQHARGAALIVGRITENPHENRQSKEWFTPLKDGGISAATVGGLGEISADVPVGNGNVNITIPLERVKEGTPAPINGS